MSLVFFDSHCILVFAFSRQYILFRLSCCRSSVVRYEFVYVCTETGARENGVLAAIDRTVSLAEDLSAKFASSTWARQLDLFCF